MKIKLRSLNEGNQNDFLTEHVSKYQKEGVLQLGGIWYLDKVRDFSTITALSNISVSCKTSTMGCISHSMPIIIVISSNTCSSNHSIHCGSIICFSNDLLISIPQSIVSHVPTVSVGN